VVEEPVGWDEAEITLVRDSTFHGINVAYSLPVKFYGAGYTAIKSVFDNYLVDTFMRCRVEHSTPDGTFQTVFEGRLNMGGCRFQFEDGLYMAEVNLEQDGNVQTLMSRMDAQVDLRSRRSLDSNTNDLPAYAWADYDLRLLPQTIINRNLLRYGGTSPFAYDPINIPVTQTYSNWLHDPIYDVLTREIPNPQDISAPYQSGIGGAYPLSNRSPVFRALGGFTTLKIRVTARYRVEVDDNGLSYDFHPILRYNTDPSAAPSLVGGTSIWTGAYVLWVPNPGDPPTQTYTYDIAVEYDTPAITDNDFVFVNFGFGAGIVPPSLTPTGSTFSSGQNIRVFQEDFVLEILEYSISPATETKATLVHEALARMAESLTGRKVTARSDFFGRGGANFSEPYLPESNLNGDGHNLALAAGLQIRQLPTRPDGTGTPIPTALNTSLKQLLANLNALYNIGWGMEPVSTFGYTNPPELIGTVEQVLRVEPKRYFYQKWPVVKVLAAIREYELRPLEKELYTRVEGGFDKYETERQNGLEEFNTRWEFNSDVQRSESTLSIRCSYIAGGYVIEKVRRIDPLRDGSIDNEYDNDVFFIATAKSSGTHFDGQAYAPLTHSERAEHFTPDSALYAPDGNLIDGRRAYNLRLAPQRSLIRWLPILFAPERSADAGPIYRVSKVEGNRNEFFRLTDGTLDNEDPARVYGKSGYDSGDNLPWYDTVELTCQYPCSWEDYIALQANRYSPVQVTSSGPADGYWWLREVNYEPAQGLARWRLIRARPDACLGVAPVFTITTATTLIELQPTEASIELEAFLDVPFTIARTCCDSPVSLSLVQGPDPELVEVTLPASPVPSPFNVRFQPLATVAEDTPFTLQLAGTACGSAGITVPGIIRRPPFAFVNAWAFDGVNDQVQVPNSPSLAMLGNAGTWSISIWSRINAIQTGTRAILSKRNTSGARRGLLFTQADGTFGIRYQVSLNDGVVLALLLGSPYTASNIGQWRHHVIVRNGSALQLWENGVLVASTTVAAAADNTAPLVFGDWEGIRFCNTRLDECQVYNKALTPTERAAIYNGGIGNAPPASALPNLVARYRCDTAAPSGPNFTLNDSSGNANHGTSSGISVSPLVPH
jgi:hypothetical protein